MKLARRVFLPLLMLLTGVEVALAHTGDVAAAEFVIATRLLDSAGTASGLPAARPVGVRAVRAHCSVIMRSGGGFTTGNP